ncbi:hypothetical protein E2542_SST20777 [Spatholobus suberectus]|nr:hypothetical protein E2542_SST20777 [Spatholobus suberectus]
MHPCKLQKHTYVHIECTLVIQNLYTVMYKFEYMIKHSTNYHIYINELQVPKSHFNMHSPISFPSPQFSHNVLDSRRKKRAEQQLHIILSAKASQVHNCFTLDHICSS